MGSLTPFPQAGGRGPWLEERSKMRVQAAPHLLVVLAQVCGATPAWQDPFLCVLLGGKVGAWPSPGLSINGPSTLVLRSGAALNDSVLSCLLLGDSQAQPKGHFSQGYQPLPSKPGFGMCWGSAHKDPAEHVDQGPPGTHSSETLGRRGTGAGAGVCTEDHSVLTGLGPEMPVLPSHSGVTGLLEEQQRGPHTHHPAREGGRESKAQRDLGESRWT